MLSLDVHFETKRHYKLTDSLDYVDDFYENKKITKKKEKKEKERIEKNINDEVCNQYVNSNRITVVCNH